MFWKQNEPAQTKSKFIFLNTKDSNDARTQNRIYLLLRSSLSNISRVPIEASIEIPIEISRLRLFAL